MNTLKFSYDTANINPFFQVIATTQNYKVLSMGPFCQWHFTISKKNNEDQNHVSQSWYLLFGKGPYDQQISAAIPIHQTSSKQFFSTVTVH